MKPSHKNDVKWKILDVLWKERSGLGFNELHDKISRMASRQLISDSLSELVNDGHVSKLPKNPRRGQKVNYNISKQFYKYRENFDTLVRFGNWTRVLTLAFKYYLEKNINPSNEVLDNFTNSLTSFLSQLYVMADHLSEPFPPELKIRFFSQSHDFYKLRLTELSKLIRKYYPGKKSIDIKTNYPEFLSQIDKNEFILWVKKNNILKKEDFNSFVKMVYDGLEHSHSTTWVK
jgi:DNA-binding HxlR family transcriptional regulator